MMWSNKSCLPWMLDKQGAVHDVEAQQEETEEEDETEAQEELSSWGILLTRSMLAKILKQSGPSLRVGGMHPEDLEATTCSGNNQARHHMPHGVSQRKKSLRPGDYSLMIQSFVKSSVAQKLKQPQQANRTCHLPLKNWMHDVLWNVNWGLRFFPWYLVLKQISWNIEVSEIWSEENTFSVFAKWQICTGFWSMAEVHW